MSGSRERGCDQGGFDAITEATGGVRRVADEERFVTKVHEEFLAATLPALDLVYNLARRIAAERDEVEDLVQETYLRAFEAWIRRRRPRKVEPWMATICLNAGRSRL